MAVFPTASHRTICRKLVESDCRSSYSHCGSYYTLDSIADYNQYGIWSVNGIHFSKSGNLMATAARLVEQSRAGYFATELKTIVHVDTHDVLRKLVRAGRLTRVRIDRQYLYCAVGPATRQQQMAVRQTTASRLGAGDTDDPTMVRAIGQLVSTCDERQRRLFAGVESLRYGHGGDTYVASLLEMTPSTDLIG